MIVVQAPGQQPAVFHEAFTIGRASTDERRHCDLTVDDEYASAPHAAIWPCGGGWVVEDRGSSNGTWLNETYSHSPASRVYGPTPLAKGDKLRVGRTVLTVVPD